MCNLLFPPAVEIVDFRPDCYQGDIQMQFSEPGISIGEETVIIPPPSNIVSDCNSQQDQK